MKKFRFKLDIKLRMGETAMEEAQYRLAEEIKCLLAESARLEAQQQRLQEAMAGHIAAAVIDMGQWQRYVDKQHQELVQCEQAHARQVKKVEEARSDLVLKHQEVKKFQRLKEKRLQALTQAERRREQRGYDEAGQNAFLRFSSRNQLGNIGA